ncbi:hypothetical protein [Jannaschia seosinensis]|uniref:hypothetical protein n=1 Tax=Jannaschia seosinensis TaxID=313367 RepID=UPI001FE14F01|nr:hypothetical protein [Jannaschia seosinensis]
MRAALVVAMVLTPSLLLPEADPQITDAIVLMALFAALFVFIEYGSAYPSLVEFRGAPPINRVRFGVMFATLMLIAIALDAGRSDALLSRLLLAVGVLLGHATDFPLSPVRLMMWLLPEGTTFAQAQQFRAAAGLAYLVSLVGLTLFAILIRLRGWPSASGSFNVWINLPTFDPTAGSDVVRQLNRDGAVNISLGLLLPYLTPPLALFVGRNYEVSVLDSPLMLTWTMTLWAFLPASLFLRGIAMRRLALMISQKRRRLTLVDGAADPAFLPA